MIFWVGIYLLCGFIAALFSWWDTAMWRKGLGQSSHLLPLEYVACLLFFVGGFFSLAIAVFAVSYQTTQWLYGKKENLNPHAWQKKQED